jgi:hypothetical protein
VKERTKELKKQRKIETPPENVFRNIFQFFRQETPKKARTGVGNAC